VIFMRARRGRGLHADDERNTGSTRAVRGLNAVAGYHAYKRPVWYLVAVLLNKLADRHLALILSKYYSSTHLENCFIVIGFKTLELVHSC
jgi:hypothetical protein